MRDWLRAPQFKDVSTQRNARLINAMIWVIIGILVLQLPLVLFGVLGAFTAIPIILPLLFFAFVVKFVLNLRFVRFAARLMVGGWGLTAVVMMMVFGGRPNVMGALLVVVIVMAGLLLGKLATSLLTVSSIGFIWVLWYLGATGRYTSPLGDFSTLESLIILTSLMIAGWIFVLIMTHDMNASWQRAMDELSERRQLQEKQYRQATELNLLHELRTILAQEEDLEGIVRKLVDSVFQRFGYSQVGVYLLNEEARQLEEIYQVGSPVAYPVLPLGSGISSRVIHTGVGELVRDVQADPDFVGVDGTFAEICVPLYGPETVVGVLNVESDQDDLSQDDFALLRSIAGYVSLALQRASLIEELREERNLLLSLIDAVPSGIYAKDRESRFTLVNRAVLQGLGQQERALMLGKTDADLVNEEYFEQTRAEELDVMESGEPLVDKEEVSVNEDAFIATLTTKVPLYDAHGELLGIVGTTSDITPRKRAEIAMRQLNEQLEDRVEERTAELRQANRELEAFAYTVSHDLRAPLRAIDGFSVIVEEELGETGSADARQGLAAIRTNIQRMSALIDGLLDFSRLNRTPLVTMRVDLDELVREIWDDLAATRQGREIEFVCEPMGTCEADQTLLRQVFTNLLSNAVKFTRNQPAPKIQVGRELRGKETVYYVKDNGVGFDLKYRDKLFGVFERLHSGSDYEGTGVGLAIVQRIILRHGGQVWAESAPGAGATFYFSLAHVRESSDS